MNELSAVVIGATGLTGHQVVEELIKDSNYRTVRVLSRRALDILHPKIEQHIVDFSSQEDLANKIGTGDVIFCCIGTTQKKVKGDKELYKKIDHDIPVNIAKAAIAKGFKKFLIISAVGANSKSSNFYLQLKGKIENSLKEFPFESLSIFQPSILNGNRKESRTGEKLAQTLMDLLSFLLLGPLEKYRAIGVNTVAKAMVFESLQKKNGIHYYQYADLMEMSRELVSDRENETDLQSK